MKVPITWITLLLAITVSCNYKYLVIETFAWRGILALWCIIGLIYIAVYDGNKTYVPFEKEDEQCP